MTHKFAINGHEGYLTVGLFADGRPGEIFIKMSKEGSTLSGLIQGFCRAFSLALQHGLSAPEAAERFRGMRFEPMGSTSSLFGPASTRPAAQAAMPQDSAVATTRAASSGRTKSAKPAPMLNVP